jgi:hypothetical protein
MHLYHSLSGADVASELSYPIPGSLRINVGFKFCDIYQTVKHNFSHCMFFPNMLPYLTHGTSQLMLFTEIATVYSDDDDDIAIYAFFGHLMHIVSAVL